MLVDAGRHLTSSHVVILRSGADAGFTLIELMVVLLILAILLAIAIPTFLGVTKSANDRASQSNLNTALVNAKVVYQSQGQSYLSTTVTNSTNFATTLGTAQLALTFGTTNSSTQSNISVAVSLDGNGIILAAWSKSGNCWYVFDNSQAISGTNSANSTAPYTGTTTVTNTAGTAGGLAIVVPTTAGTTYAEVKNDTTAADCSAAAPKATGTGSTYQLSTSAFPS